MAISDSQKLDYLWKKLGYGFSKTDTLDNKLATNESIASPLLLRGDNVWSQSDQIPSTIPGSSNDIVVVYPTSNPVECSPDITATANRTWKTGIIDWIPPEIGATYLVKVYIHTSGDASNAASSGDQVSPQGSGGSNDDQWFFDYQSGLLNFIGTNLPNGINFTGKSVYISGARYIGQKGVVSTGAGTTFTDITVGAAVTINSDGINAPTGIITASSFVGDGSGLTNITATGSGIEIRNSGSVVGTASTVNFATNLTSTISEGVAIINASGISSVFDDTTPKLGGELDLNSNNITGTGNLNVTGIITGTSFSGIGSDITGITLGQLSNVDISAIGAGSTNYLMVYDPTVPGFKFVSPASLGINNDYNPDPDIDDFGTYP
jgi:hypothetical protein